MNIKKLGSKIRRIIDIFFDNSDALKDNPSFRLQIIKSIWNE